MDTDLISLGYAAQVFQQSPKLLEIGLRAVGAEPQLMLNGTVYYSFDAMAAAAKFAAGDEGAANE